MVRLATAVREYHLGPYAHAFMLDQPHILLAKDFGQQGNDFQEKLHCAVLLVPSENDKARSYSPSSPASTP